MQILLDGMDTRHLNLQWLRSHMGLVSQEPVLFAGTVTQNIAFGCDSTPDQAAIEDAARTANAHDFIAASPGGYSTQACACACACMSATACTCMSATAHSAMQVLCKEAVLWCSCFRWETLPCMPLPITLVHGVVICHNIAIFNHGFLSCHCLPALEHCITQVARLEGTWGLAASLHCPSWMAICPRPSCASDLACFMCP